MGQKIQVGLVGSGFAAHFHLGSYAKVYGVDFSIRGIYGRNTSKAQHLASEYQLPIVYDSYEAMLADNQIHVVDLVVPNHSHLPLALQAARAGKHIICEKPLTGFFGPETTPIGNWSAAGFSREAMLRAVMSDVNRACEAIQQAGVI